MSITYFFIYFLSTCSVRNNYFQQLLFQLLKTKLKGPIIPHRDTAAFATLLSYSSEWTDLEEIWLIFSHGRK